MWVEFVVLFVCQRFTVKYEIRPRLIIRWGRYDLLHEKKKKTADEAVAWLDKALDEL